MYLNYCNNFNKQDMPEELIFTIAQDIKEFANLHEANDYFTDLSKQNPQFKALDFNVYRYKDYFINVGKKFTMTSHAYGLRAVQNCKVACAPELIAFADAKNGFDCVLVTRIKGSEEAAPVPYRMVSNDVSVRAKQKLMDDIDKLSQEEIANMSMFDKNFWHYVPAQETIIISDWGDLAGCKNDQVKVAVKKRIGEMCGLY